MSSKTNISFGSRRLRLEYLIEFNSGLCVIVTVRFAHGRMEKIKIKERRGQAKVVGTIITVAGALVMIMYRGPIIEFVWTKGRAHHDDAAAGHNSAEWLKGTFLLIGSCFCWSAFFIVQVSSRLLPLSPWPNQSRKSGDRFICFTNAVQHAAIVSGGADADDLDMRHGSGAEHSGHAGYDAWREALGHRLRHAADHRCLLGERVASLPPSLRLRCSL